ncbi:peptidoglycan editing factor PgeF [Spongisporangium articulatum]|uniref:Purine nucleoside phosphorylase n=1 Tax=Spongisporangium articulatum TaxID=3362603 RepID=A0ABW8AJS6_9ACTN
MSPTRGTAVVSVPVQRFGGLAVEPFRAFAEAGAQVAVTTRDGGVSAGRYATLNLGLHVGDDAAAVVENRRRALAALSTTLDRAVFCVQSHEARVAVVGAADAGRGARSEADALPATDALVTVETDLVLAVLVADCVPVVLLDPVRRALAVVHAGWRGTVAGVAAAAVSTLVDGGSRPSDLLAGIGPSIAPDAYQVGSDVRGAAQAAFGSDVDRVVRADPGAPGRWLFDLWHANRLQLQASGVPAAHIDVAGLETGPGTPFYSHRFEAAPGAPTGRFGLLARLT